MLKNSKNSKKLFNTTGLVNTHYHEYTYPIDDIYSYKQFWGV